VATFASDGRRLPFEVLAGQEPGTAPRCRAGELRGLRLQALVIDGQLTYLRRGGCEHPCRSPQPTVHMPASAFARTLRLLPMRARRGNGAPVPGCRRRVGNAPELAGPELAHMYYKHPAAPATHTPAGARWFNYGDPGRRYHEPGLHPADYNYLLWNLPLTADGHTLHGGGLVEDIIDAGQPVQLCGTLAITLPSYSSKGTPNGSVRFAYAELPIAHNPPIYGWPLQSYTFAGHPHPTAR
jgi:hypothetical protein